MNTEKTNQIQEHIITNANGLLCLTLYLIGFVACVALTIFGAIGIDSTIIPIPLAVTLLVTGILALIVLIILCCGLRVVAPNEALVLTLFGKYYGTIKEPGFYMVNPFVTDVAPATGSSKTDIMKKRIPLKTMTLNNSQQKVNDALGNPVIIGAVVIWKVANPTDAVFNVENYREFLSIQCDSTIRKIARLYPYDVFAEDNEDEAHEKTLRGSSQEIANSMRDELQKKVAFAGLIIEEVRITHLSYSEEIAAAMLQKQQATAVIAARKKIVEGAVGMVQMAIDELSENEVVVLDDERKAAMVSNLLVVLCGNKEAQPVVNSSSIY